MIATILKGVVRNGRIEVAEPIEFPDGTEVMIAESRAVESDDDPMSPEEIARVLAAMEKIEPFMLTPEEEAAWEADRKARKEREKAHFMENAQRLRRMWDDPLPPR